MTSTNPPIILDGKILSEGVTALITSFASDLESDLSMPMLSKNEIQTLTRDLSTYLSFFVSNKLRRSTMALRPADLDFRILRSPNPADEYKDEKVNSVKGDKKWYRLVLFESIKIEDKIEVQTLADAEMSINKGGVLTAFEEALKKRNAKWVAADKAIVKRLKKESRIRNLERKRASEMEEGKRGGAKEVSSGNGKGKGKKGAPAIITIDDDSEDEEEEDWVDAWG